MVLLPEQYTKEDIILLNKEKKKSACNQLCYHGHELVKAYIQG